MNFVRVYSSKRSRRGEIKGRLFLWVFLTKEVKIIAAFYERRGKLPTNVLLSKHLAPADH